MTDDRPLRLCLLFVAIATPVVLGSGCARPRAALQLTSYKDPYHPETYDIELDQCAYSVGPGGDHHIVGRARYTPEGGAGGPIEQLLHVHLFWRPLPGKTFDNPTTVDATLRYAIVTERGTVVYCGTGFVYVRERRMSDDMIVEIESARLRVESRVGDPPELFGRARLSGELVAEKRPSLAVDLRRQLDLHSGPSKGQ